MKKVKIAQIGTNGYSHGNNIWNSLRKQSDLFEIVGYALPENEREQIPNRTKDFDDYREMTVEEILNDPEIEAVAIETEEIHLTKYAIMAARAGKHIHMEKPGGVDLAQFKELIDLVRAKNLTFTIGYMYRFNPKIREAIEKIKNGDIGEVYSVEAHMNCNNPVEIRNWLAHFPGGMMFYLGRLSSTVNLRDFFLPFANKTFSRSVGSDDDSRMISFVILSGVSPSNIMIPMVATIKQSR